MALSQLLANINNIVQSKEYVYTAKDLPENIMSTIVYSNYMSIENAFNNIYPVYFETLKVIPDFSKEYNTQSITTLIYFIIGFGIPVFIIVFLYTMLIYLTNKNMSRI